jgi:hypothetical protein
MRAIIALIFGVTLSIKNQPKSSCHEINTTIPHHFFFSAFTAFSQQTPED